MNKPVSITESITQGADIIHKAQSVGLDPRILYEAVIDLSSKGLLTANCINMAAGILLNDLGLPLYFFQHIQKDSLINLLQSIATSIKLVDGKVVLFGRVAHVDFDLTQENNMPRERVRIATENTRDTMESVLEELITGHRREYYYSPESQYYTYLIRPETVTDFTKTQFAGSKFLFSLVGDFEEMPEPTRVRYEKFLANHDISRGGLRLLRVSPANYETVLDNTVLLNYALGPKAQRLKHKDICESGSKGVIVPHPQYANYSMESLYDYTEGIMDLILLDDSVVDYYGKPELIFFGPDEGTAPLMDAIALRAKDRGYSHWRTLTTGKSFGIPHDTFGLLDTGELFGLYDEGDKGVDLQIDGTSVVLTNNLDEIYDRIGGQIESSGMTTTSIMSSFRTLISHYNCREEELNLMITGGPDGDLGANEIQCYKGNICLVIDGGSILFDPLGLDKRELVKIAFRRNSSPRANFTSFPSEKLSAEGFMVPLAAKNIILPDDSHQMAAHKSLLGKQFTDNNIREAVRNFCNQEGIDNDSCDLKSREIIISDGDVIEDILKSAETNKCDLIVLGGHQNIFSKTSIGSTLKGVLKKSKTPVTVVPSLLL